MKAKEYRLIELCVENGVKLGIRRAYKHVDEPSKEEIEQAVENAVMLEISEWFDFEDEYDA